MHCCLCMIGCGAPECRNQFSCTSIILKTGHACGVDEITSKMVEHKHNPKTEHTVLPQTCDWIREEKNSATFFYNIKIQYMGKRTNPNDGVGENEQHLHCK